MNSHDPKPLSARLTPDEAERLAAGFRPSWELDDAPFTGAGTLSATDMVTLQGGGTLAEVRAKAEPVVVSRPPPAAVVAPEPETKVIVDDTVVTPPPPMALVQEVREPAGTHGPNGTAVMAIAALPVPTQHAAPPAAAMTATDLGGGGRGAAEAPMRPRAMSLGEDSAALPTVFGPKRPRMWMGIGAVGVAVLGLAVWAVAGSGGRDAKATAPPSAATVEARAATAAPTRLGTDTTAAPSSTAALTPGSTPAPQVTPTQTPAPTATPVPTYAPAARTVTPAPATPRAAVATAPSPAPKPHPKPTTIVRDVPF
jgi:hypothetical protein